MKTSRFTEEQFIALLKQANRARRSRSCVVWREWTGWSQFVAWFRFMGKSALRNLRTNGAVLHNRLV